jgi:hypothetical protein
MKKDNVGGGNQPTEAEAGGVAAGNRRMGGCHSNLTYEKRKDASGKRTAIPDDIKTAALEAMMPQDLESHVQLNQSRFNTFDDLLEEINRYVEHKTGKSLKIVSAASALANQNALGGPMDVSSVGYKGSRKGSAANFLGSCSNCCKTGHKAADCWAKAGQKGQSTGQGTYSKGSGTATTGTGNKGNKGSKGGPKGSKGKNSKGKGSKSKGKGPGKKGKGKGLNNFEEEWAQEDQTAEQGWEARKKIGPTTAKNGKRVMDCCWAVSKQTNRKTSPRQSRKESPRAKAEKVEQRPPLPQRRQGVRLQWRPLLRIRHSWPDLED